MSKSCREYIKELKQQLVLTEKALELVLIDMFTDNVSKEHLIKISKEEEEYYIDRAKEMMKSE